MFNIILKESLPDEYLKVKINTDFKQALKFFRILDNEELDDIEKTNLIIKVLFIGQIPNNVNLWDLINYFLSGGDDSLKEDSSDKKVFCFNQDAGLIYAAFRQVYNIDLRLEKMHWWTFLELFKGLPDTTQFSKVVEIRQKEITKDMDKKTKLAIMKAKTRYALKTNKTLSMDQFFK